MTGSHGSVSPSGLRNQYRLHSKPFNAGVFRNPKKGEKKFIDIQKEMKSYIQKDQMQTSLGSSQKKNMKGIRIMKTGGIIKIPEGKESGKGKEKEGRTYN